MKAGILAGGLGTRMQEVTYLIPKPMVKIGNQPILWHIMKHFASHGIDEFCIALGYRGDIIKDYFVNYHSRQDDICIDLKTKEVKSLNTPSLTENWQVKLIETGEKTQTGGRVARMEQYFDNETFLLTYGDGVSDVDIKALLEFHKSHGKIATVTAVHQPSRFGALQITENNMVPKFAEKPVQSDSYINGGFFVFEPEIFKYLSKDEDCILERFPLEKLASDGQLCAYHHKGFWQCMDTVRDINYLNELWNQNDIPWKTW